MKKIDQNGNYLPFIGTTIISFVKCQKLFKDIHEYISCHHHLFFKYYSLLPVESYHMTVKNHTVCSGSEKQWYENFVADFAKYEQIKAKCNDYPGEITVNAVGCHFGGTFALKVDVCENNVENLRKEIVKLGSKREDNFKFHITFAYNYRPFKNDDIELCEECKKISKYVLDLLLKEKIVLKKPQLCYFKDMTDFKPL